MWKKMKENKKAPVTSMEMSNKNRLLSWNEYPGGVILSIQKSKRAKNHWKHLWNLLISRSHLPNIEHWYADIVPLNDQKSSFSCKIKRKHFLENDYTQTLLNIKRSKRMWIRISTPKWTSDDSKLYFWALFWTIFHAINL